MKKVLISTYCTVSSLGSILQSFGLKNILREIGVETEIVLKEKDAAKKRRKKLTVKGAIVKIHELITKSKRNSAINKRNDFMNEHLDIRCFHSYNDLNDEELLNNVDCLLAGSDQIWHPKVDNPAFFLDFGNDKKKISYAASMGIETLNETDKLRFKNYLKSFDSISVREEECVDVLQPLTEKEIQVHIDPVFLCSAEEWRKYEEEYPLNKPYILVYMIYWNEECKEKLKKLKKSTGLPILAICNGLSRVYADEKLYDVGVGEFLWLIDHAEYVVSSSFHGVAFSILFNKPFSAVINPLAPSRIENLMSVLSIPKVKLEQLNEHREVDYKKINENITAERNRSIDYLKKVLE